MQGQTPSRSGPAELDSGLVWRGAVARVTPALALFRSALRHDQRDVVVLLLRTELPNLIDNR
jgi:hypothetical protein